MENEAKGTANIRHAHHRHLVALPYPGRGHINPMLNLCYLILSAQPDFLISFVVTEEWLGFLTAELHPRPLPNLRLVAIPQVIPSEIGRAANSPGFYEAVNTKLENPFEQLLDRLQPPATAIISDTFITWVVGLGSKRKIPVASLFTQSASVFTVYYHLDLLVQHGHLPLDLDASDLSKGLTPEKGKEKVDYIPGLPPTAIEDLPTLFDEVRRKMLPWFREAMSVVNKAQCLLFTSIHELEEPVINTLKTRLPIPIYPIGPMIPYFNLQSDSVCGNDAKHHENQSYFEWLDSQPPGSVLYISQGSFRSISHIQLDEIIAGIKQSVVRFLWVTRGDCATCKDDTGVMGFLVPWCDQLKVLCHPSIRGFWTHCGWNSTWEAIYAGVPMLTCPIAGDQFSNSKLIVSDWKIGIRAVINDHKGTLVTRHEIAQTVRQFMDSQDDEQKEMVNRAKSLQEICRQAIAADGGSAASYLVDFIRDIC